MMQSVVNVFKRKEKYFKTSLTVEKYTTLVDWHIKDRKLKQNSHRQCFDYLKVPS